VLSQVDVAVNFFSNQAALFAFAAISALRFCALHSHSTSPSSAHFVTQFYDIMFYYVYLNTYDVCSVGRVLLRVFIIVMSVDVTITLHFMHQLQQLQRVDTAERFDTKVQGTLPYALRC